jgi:hypothetical protein
MARNDTAHEHKQCDPLVSYRWADPKAKDEHAYHNENANKELSPKLYVSSDYTPNAILKIHFTTDSSS